MKERKPCLLPTCPVTTVTSSHSQDGRWDPTKSAGLPRDMALKNDLPLPWAEDCWVERKVMVILPIQKKAPIDQGLPGGPGAKILLKAAGDQVPSLVRARFLRP